MKQKTAKLRKLEKNRFSILTDILDQCFICQKSPVDIHEIYGGANRKVSMQNGFCIPLCRYHHKLITDIQVLNKTYKIMCQDKYEQLHSRSEFIALIGKNYLDR